MKRRNTFRKRSSLRWTANSLRTEHGAVYATEWRASHRGFDMLLTNYPGSRSLDWKITRADSPNWWSGGNEDRFEYTVATLKDSLFAKTEALADRIATSTLP